MEHLFDNSLFFLQNSNESLKESSRCSTNASLVAAQGNVIESLTADLKTIVYNNQELQRLLRDARIKAQRFESLYFHTKQDLIKSRNNKY
jgi:hypothetical protein